jgi:hypothetical protein
VTEPANEPLAPASDSAGRNVPQSDTEKQLKRSGLGWQHILMITGAGMLAAGAGIWRTRRAK